MPELPEVEALRAFLDTHLVGKEIARVLPVAISVLKTYDPPVHALEGRVFAGATRRGKFLQLRTEDGPWLVIVSTADSAAVPQVIGTVLTLTTRMRCAKL